MRPLKLSLLFIVATLFISNSSKSQEPLKHKKKIYKAADGKLYANRNLPLYFRISTSADADAESYLLMPSANSKKYANPMYLDSEGYNTFRSPSKVDTVTKKIVYPLEDIIYELYSDSKSPVTKFSFEYKKYYKKDIATINNNTSTITFNDLPKGKYAINILHDENENGKIDKKFILPIEGIGFSHYTSIGFTNKPKFSKASFELDSNTKMNIKVIYM